MRYTIHHQSGVITTSTAKTLAGAKREASKDATHGGGSVTVHCDGNPVCRREFWQSLDRFGWEKWENI